MFTSLQEIDEALVSGRTLSWVDPETQKLDTITLSTASQRALYQYIRSSPSLNPGSLSDTFIAGLKEAYTSPQGNLNETQIIEIAQTPDLNETWLLHKIETYGFGGINLYKGEVFTYELGGKSISLEGENGSGKSSLISAIQWALTGQIVKDKPDQKRFENAESVYSSEDSKVIGSWPPIASYPPDTRSLSESPSVWVRLEFVDEKSRKVAQVKRTLENGTISEEIDDEIKKLEVFFETCILMPARLPHINLSNKTTSLSEAVQKLTGLDTLSGIGEFVSGSGIGHINRQFLKYSKSENIDAKKRDFDAATSAAITATETIGNDEYNVASLKGKHDQELTESTLTDIKELVKDKITSLLAIIDNEVPENYELEKNIVSLREQTTDLASTLRTNRERLIPVVAEKLKAITATLTPEIIARIDKKIASVEKDISSAAIQFKKHESDRKLKLKILAAQYHGEVDENEEIVNCPLCDEPLTLKIELAQELNKIKKENLDKQKDLSDKIRDLKDEILTEVPSQLNTQIASLGQISPKTDFIKNLNDNLINKGVLYNTFKGIRHHLEVKIQQTENDLPDFVFEEPVLDDFDLEPEKISDLNNTIKGIQRICSLSVWWGRNKTAYYAFWTDLVGIKDPEMKVYPSDSLQGKLAAFIDALNKSKPYEQLLGQVVIAIEKTKKWNEINKEQKLREDIVKAVEPLSKLRKFVEAKSKETISDLSGQITSILNAIHISERLKFGDTKLDKSSLIIHTKVVNAYKIDATLIANTSWVRAILWAFIFALRNSLLEKIGFNPFPLIILDDPQSTFDAKHRRKWAEQITAFAKMDSTKLYRAQFLITCHDIQFVNCLEVESFPGIYSQLYPVTSYNPVLKIIEGDTIERLWVAATETKDQLRSKQYLAEVRIHIESLVRIMLHGEALGVMGGNIWGNLRRHIDDARKKDIPPYNRPPFENLLKYMDESLKEVKIINYTHHYDDSDIGYAQAADVNKFWKEKAFKAIKNAFSVYREYRLVNGEPRALFATNPIVELPDGQSDVIKTKEISIVGRAAALTNGRTCDGYLTIANDTVQNKIKFFNHSAYQLSAQTLEPIAKKGDILLVSNFEKVDANRNDLTVTAYEDRLLARRYEKVEGHPELVALTAQAVNPKDLKRPYVVHHSSIKENTKKIIGVIYNKDDLALVNPDEEIKGIDGTIMLSRIFQYSSLLKVVGRSAEPYALDGQYILTGPPTRNKEEFLEQNAKPVIATDSEGQSYFKRLRYNSGATVIILESLDISGVEDILIFYNDRNPIIQIAPVRGIIFNLPNS